jgi:DNA-binding MarR family transcriptional regulator
MRKSKERSFSRSFSIPVSLLDKAEEIAKSKNSNLNKACREALALWVEREEQRIEGES